MRNTPYIRSDCFGASTTRLNERHIPWAIARGLAKVLSNRRVYRDIIKRSMSKSEDQHIPAPVLNHLSHLWQKELPTRRNSRVSVQSDISPSSLGSKLGLSRTSVGPRLDLIQTLARPSPDLRQTFARPHPAADRKLPPHHSLAARGHLKNS